MLQKKQATTAVRRVFHLIVSDVGLLRKSGACPGVTKQMSELVRQGRR